MKLEPTWVPSMQLLWRAVMVGFGTTGSKPWLTVEDAAGFEQGDVAATSICAFGMNTLGQNLSVIVTATSLVARQRKKLSVSV